MIEILFADPFPGEWEVRQLPAAKEARAFWLKVIDRFSNHDFSDQFIEDSRWKGFLESFKSA
jgi:hypothetical protein